MNPPPVLCIASFLPAAEAGELYETLVRTVTWDERIRARGTASFGTAYNYSDMTYPDVPMPPAIANVAARVHSQVGWLPNNCLANYYRDGKATMGFHSDSEAGLEPETGVAIVSLGAARELVFRAALDKTAEFRYLLPSGALLVMPWGIQNDWRHGVPKADEDAGGRISLTFRRVLDNL